MLTTFRTNQKEEVKTQLIRPGITPDTVVVTYRSGGPIALCGSIDKSLTSDDWYHCQCYVTESYASARDAYLRGDEMVKEVSITDHVHLIVVHDQDYGNNDYPVVFYIETFGDFCARCPDEHYVRDDGKCYFSGLKEYVHEFRDV